MTTTKVYDRELLSYKINWEGGIFATLDYGLRPEDIAEPQLRAAWSELRELHSRMRPLVSAFEKLLREGPESNPAGSPRT